MDEQEGTLIRFTGVLREDHRFIHVPAWETSRVFERPETGDGRYVVDLLDRGGKIVSRVSPRIEFRPPENPNSTGLYLSDVLAYVPMHPSARVLIFRRLLPDEMEIHRAELAANQPVVENLVVEGEPQGELRLKWSSSHDRPVTFTVFFWPDGRSPLLLAAGLQENGLVTDGANLPGPTGRFAVAVSDGLRSRVAVSRPMDGFSTAIRVRIVSPPADSVVPPDQPVELIAVAEDVFGAATTIDEITWWIDGQVAAKGLTAAAHALDPGEHEISATGFRGPDRLDRNTIRVTVAERNADQEAFLKRVANLPSLDRRRRETGA